MYKTAFRCERTSVASCGILRYAELYVAAKLRRKRRKMSLSAARRAAKRVQCEHRLIICLYLIIAVHPV